MRSVMQRRTRTAWCGFRRVTKGNTMTDYGRNRAPRKIHLRERGNLTVCRRVGADLVVSDPALVTCAACQKRFTAYEQSLTDPAVAKSLGFDGDWANQYDNRGSKR